MFDAFRVELDQYLDGCRVVKGLDLSDPTFRNTVVSLLDGAVRSLLVAGASTGPLDELGILTARELEAKS